MGLRAGQAAQCVDELGRDRLLRVVRTAIRMAPWDCIVQVVFFVITRDEIYACQKLRFGLGGNGPKLTGKERRGGLVAMGSRSQHQVLESTAHPDVLFPQKGVERPDVSLRVDIQLNRG